MDIRSAADFLKFLAEEGAFSPRNEETVFSLSVEPIIRGLVTLEKALPGSLQEITACQTTGMYDALSGTSYRRKFLAYNRMASGAFTGSDVFGLLGEVGLQAIIVETGVGWQGRQATNVTLVLPAWEVSNEHGFDPATLTIVTWDTSGAAMAERFSPYAPGEDGKPLAITRRDLLEHLLGVNPLDKEVRTRRSSGNVGLVLRFPGATEYLATHLPILGDYLTELSKRL